MDERKPFKGFLATFISFRLYLFHASFIECHSYFRYRFQDVFRKISCIFFIEDVAAIVIVVGVVIVIVFVISSLPSKYRWCVPRVRHLPEKEDFIYGWVIKYVVDKCLLLLLVETTRWSGIWKLWQLPICYCCLSMLEFPFCNLVLVVRNACGQHQHRPRHIGL